MPEAISLRMMPPKKPEKAPKPARSASLPCLPSIISPKTAPINGPIIIPRGGKKNKPKTKPTTGSLRLIAKKLDKIIKRKPKFVQQFV